MQLEIQHPLFKKERLAVETAGWLHAPRLFLNGNAVPKQKGRYMVMADSGVEMTIQLKYNYVDPIPKVKIGEEIFKLANPLKWYEYAWIGIPIVLIFFGGAIGGLVGALGATANGRVFRSGYGASARYGLSEVITLGTFIAFVVLASIFRLFIGVMQK